MPMIPHLTSPSIKTNYVAKNPIDLELDSGKTEVFMVHTQNSPIQNSPIQKSPKHQKKVQKNSPIQNSPKPVEFLDLDLLAPTELIYALKTQTGAIKDQRVKIGTINWMKIKGLMV